MEQALTPSLWAACAVLYQLSYWSTWELVIKWVRDQPVEDASGCTINYMGKRYINCALEYKVVVTIAVIIIIISDKQVLHIYTFWALCNFLGEEDHCPPPPPQVWMCLYALFIDLFDTKFSCLTSPLTRHHDFFGNSTCHLLDVLLLLLLGLG